MTLVHMEDRRLDAQRPERPHPADAQQHLLRNPGGIVAAVELLAQGPMFRLVPL